MTLFSVSCAPWWPALCPPTIEALVEAYADEAAFRGDILDESLADNLAAFRSDPRLAEMRKFAFTLGAELEECAPGSARDDVIVVLARRVVSFIPPQVLADMKTASAGIAARQDAMYFFEMQCGFREEEEIKKSMEEKSSNAGRYRSGD